jgi:hypothetical protein
VLVTAAKPSTEKLPAAPRFGAEAASGRAATPNDGPANERIIARKIEIVKNLDLFILFLLLQKT